MNTKPLAVLGVLLCVLCAFLLESQARTVFRLEPKDFVGTWIGYDESGLQFSRLELDRDGRGFLAISYLSNTPVCAYRVTWRIDDVHGLTISIAAVDPKLEPITLNPILSGAAMSQLTFEIRGKGWSRKLLLFNEAEFQARSTSTAARMKKLRDEGK